VAQKVVRDLRTFSGANFFSVLEVKLSAEWTIYQVISMVMLSFSYKWKTLYCLQHLQTDESNGMTGKKISDLAQKHRTSTRKGSSTGKCLYLPIKIKWSLKPSLLSLVITKPVDLLL